MRISHDLLEEILCRLPVKHLLRCRCVAKGWCSLIDSNAFVKKHLKNTLDCNASGVHVINGFDGRFWVVESDDGSTSVVEIDDPIKMLLSDSEYCIAANALLCVFKSQMNDIFLFNPSTRKVRKLPSAPPEFPRGFNGTEDCVCGFGYDHVNDDYKVVKIVQSFVQSGGTMVVVYSLKTNSWKQIQNVPSKYFLTIWGIFGNGALYWFLVKDLAYGFETIVGFDLGLEQFKEVPFPPVNKNYIMENKRGLFTPPAGESLCLLDTYSDLSVDVWLMNNYGEKNTWYKAFSVKQLCPLAFGILRPLAFSKSHKDVLLELDCQKLVWYNIERKTVKSVRLPRILVKFDSHFCTESLLQLTEDKSLQRPSPDKQKKQQKKR
ncbi:hypothetical protein DCAR_0104629 [Daucus carota subsp. sativus]|uniref:F-box domain-containing protein n=2 Tax=Daucus carota subsp. sativus TaxID=79200 RepID=A0A166IZ95_DAUCS|nr:hypothetical protein DCAR_0104629 [Daucus carota subsp. sativus]